MFWFVVVKLRIPKQAIRFGINVGCTGSVLVSYSISVI